jgi:hypothetical protein
LADLPIASIFFAILSKTPFVASTAVMRACASMIFAMVASYEMNGATGASRRPGAILAATEATDRE